MTITVLFISTCVAPQHADRLYNKVVKDDFKVDDFKVVKDDFKVEAECAAEDDYSSIIISKWLEDQYRFQKLHEGLESRCHSGSDPPENPIRARSDMLAILILL